MRGTTPTQASKKKQRACVLLALCLSSVLSAEDPPTRDEAAVAQKKAADISAEGFESILKSDGFEAMQQAVDEGLADVSTPTQSGEIRRAAIGALRAGKQEEKVEDFVDGSVVSEDGSVSKEGYEMGLYLANLYVNLGDPDRAYTFATRALSSALSAFNGQNRN